MSEPSIEVWKNTAAGMRWVTTLNQLGNETSKVVRGNRTFSVTTLERRLNQDQAATPQSDLFRDGTFVLVTAGTKTEELEFNSPDALTDAELTAFAHEIMAENMSVEAVMHPIASAITMGRLREALILERASKQDVDKVEVRVTELEGGPEVRRAASAGSSSGGDTRVPDTSKVDGESGGDEVASPGRELVPERNK